MPSATTVEEPCETPSPSLATSPSTEYLREESTQEKPFYGWVMLPVAMLILVASSPGQTFGFAFFNPHFQQALSLTSTQLSTAYLFATLLAAVPLSYVGSLTDRFGLRKSLFATVIALSLGCMLLAATSNIAMLCLSFFVMRLLGPGMMVLLANNTLAAWFDKRLGKASGAMQLSMAGAVALIPAGMLLLINSFGWRQAYVIIGCGLALTMLPVLWFFYRESPEELGQERDGIVPGPQVLPAVPAGSVAENSTTRGSSDFTLAEAMRTPAYWVLIAATSAWAMIGTGIVFHMEALFATRGLAETTMQLAPTALAIGMAAMQLCGGVLAARVAIRFLEMLAIGGIGSSSLAVMAAPGAKTLL
ncbi:MAG: MFS transporter, partial [Lacipirellulaceae bacterium]